MTNPLIRQTIQNDALILTIDNPPVNVISQALRAALLDAVATAEDKLARGIVTRVIITAIGKTFVAGADAREFDGPPLEPQLPAILDRLTRLPAIAAIHGAALGGGLEIALACRLRVLGPKAKLGLPEVTLGVVPGAGGTQRLPRLVGLETALSLITQGRIIGAEDALGIGLGDHIAPDPLAFALSLDALALAKPATDDLPAPAKDPALLAATRASLQATKRGQNAPLAALDLIANGLDTDITTAMAQERAAFLRLRTEPQARALRHMFFAEKSAGPDPAIAALTPAPLTHALVAGGGLMGSAIAFALARAGLSISILETDADAATRAQTNIAGLIAEAVKRGKLAPDNAPQIHVIWGADIPLPPADIAIEAIIEDMGAKKALLARLADQLSADCLLATNTSYLDINEMARDLPNPARFLGLHFFAPAHVMKLLEVISTSVTSDQTLAQAFALAKALDKIPVTAGICDGFIGNRLLSRYRQVADHLMLQGASPWEIDRAMEEFGYAMGPYRAQDMSGLDIAYANRRRKPRPDPQDPLYVPIADAMVEDLRRLGRKTNGGWYDYEQGKAVPSADVAALVKAQREARGIENRDQDADTIARILMLALIAESFLILDEKIARRPEDIDLVQVHGFGFPRWRGGPMQLAREWGVTDLAAALAAIGESVPAGLWPMQKG